MNVCPTCGRSFETADPRKVHCTPACRKRATYERARAANPPTRGPGRPPLVPPADPARLAAALAKIESARGAAVEM